MQLVKAAMSAAAGDSDGPPPDVLHHLAFWGMGRSGSWR